MTDPACFCQKITPLQTIRSAVGPTKLQDWRIAVISHPSKMLDGLPRAIAVAEGQSRLLYQAQTPGTNLAVCICSENLRDNAGERYGMDMPTL
jgi:hypothetical protein